MTVKSVCERAGVGRTSFYSYFEGADALAATVSFEAADEVKGRFDQLHRYLLCDWRVFGAQCALPARQVMAERIVPIDPERLCY